MCLASLAMRETRIETALKLHLTPVRMKITYSKFWWGCGEKRREAIHCGWDGKLEQPLWISVWRILQNSKMRSSTWASCTAPCRRPQDSTPYSIGLCSAVPITTLPTIARKWKRPKCLLTDERLHTHKSEYKELTSVIKKSERRTCQANAWNWKMC